MPYRAAGTIVSNRIELSIPVLRMSRRSMADDDDDDDDSGTCYICANSFCAAQECCRSLTHLACCTQTMCCACVMRQAQRCTCNDDCEEIIAWCPFCRKVSPVQALDIFLGASKTCKACVAKDDAAAPPPAPPHTAPAPPPAPEPEVIDLTNDSDDD